MKIPIALAALLACAGCDRRQEAAPAENIEAVADNYAMPMDNSAEPPGFGDPAPAHRPAPPPSDVGPLGGPPGPTNSFIVCPGNPRCPKAGESAPPEVVD